MPDSTEATLVDRLRSNPTIYPRVCLEAADEIESLQRLWQGALAMLNDAIDELTAYKAEVAALKERNGVLYRKLNGGVTR